MDGIVIAPVGTADIPLLDAALRQLATDLNDRYTADQATLAAAVCGPGADCLALLATRNGSPMGAVLAAPVFSTMRGGAGLYVSDLWVTESVRGKGLARRLLASALQHGTQRNAGHFLKLTVYRDNPGARAAYDRLGFTGQPDETNMTLTGPALENLKERP
ncbi:GNAT family N-acetyltransferase [Puniceibacterium sediminis]|uniref:Acetyltransferase (GNAT) family protein n=1 Tax=Puniceibacterium sediminis TaxID=1608407 RepID=A0A238WA14_9RHOB|nr:GNAT family N-acetyltransferase [Puniceibacterium sediminis]SNR43392.1 Acetyltransferase (GNAT) family protein [Puniceibacterium sediminis]